MPIYTKCSKCKKKIPKGTLCECRKERHKDYDKRVRYQENNKKYAEFYNSTGWDRMSSHIQTKYSCLCLMCLLEYNEIVPNDVVHHIEELRENFEKRLDEDNLIPLCHGCHNTLHSSYTEKIKRGLLKLLKIFSDNYI